MRASSSSSAKRETEMFDGWVVGSLGVSIGVVVVSLGSGEGCAEITVMMLARRVVVMLECSILGRSVT